MVAKSARSAAAGGEHPFMRWLISARASGVERHWRRVGGVALAAVLGLALAGSGSGAPGASQTGKATAFTGYAFDACNAPKIDSLAAWLASPYRALGIYIGGVNRACANNQLTPDWTAAAVSTGWGLIPLYVGLQAPCVGQGGLAKISPSLASSQGTAAADDADARASTVGLAPGSPIYFDMEGYALSNAELLPGRAVVRHRLGQRAPRARAPRRHLRERRLDDPRHAGARHDRLCSRRRLDRELERQRERVRRPVRLRRPVDEPPAAPPVPRLASRDLGWRDDRHRLELRRRRRRRRGRDAAGAGAADPAPVAR